MKNDVRTVLETPFTPDQIKQRKGLWGKMLDYIEGHSVIQRLNDAFESDWSFSVVEHHILDEEVLVLGKLTAGEIEKMQFGSNKVTRDSETKKVLCLGDDLKAAATDSLKKCASLLGVGLHLYGEIVSTKPEQPARRKRSTHAEGKKTDAPEVNVVSTESIPDVPKSDTTNTSNSAPAKDNGNGNKNNPVDIKNLITAKQRQYILTLGRRQSFDESKVNSLCIDNYHLMLHELNKTQASELIAMLTA